MKFSNFVEPGQVLVMKATIMKQTDETTTLKAEATVERENCGNGPVSAGAIQLGRPISHAGGDR